MERKYSLLGLIDLENTQSETGIVLYKKIEQLLYSYCVAQGKTIVLPL